MERGLRVDGWVTHRKLEAISDVNRSVWQLSLISVENHPEDIDRLPSNQGARSFQCSHAKVIWRNTSEGPNGFTKTSCPPRLSTSDQRCRPIG
jgi:hypothetical protein